MAQEVSIKSQDGIFDFAKDYVKNNNIILAKNYDLQTAMSNLYLNLIQVEDKNGKKALEVCTKESIQEAVMQCINNGLDIGKKQGYFIPRGDKLTFMSSYFGNVKQAKATSRVSIISNVIRDGEQADIETRVDGSIIVHHKPSIKCLNKKIIAAYAVATDMDTGRVVNSDIMSIEEIKKSWLKSTNGCKVGKEFEHEMAKRTIENRLAKHFINKSDDSEKLFITDKDGNQIVVKNYDELVADQYDYTINTDEQIQKEKEKYEPKAEEDVVSVEDLKLDPIEPISDIPEGAIEIDYNLVRGGANKDKYRVVPNSFNKDKYTCYAFPVGENENANN